MKDKKMMALDILGKIERGNRYQQSCSAQYLQGLSEMMERASKYKNNRSTPLVCIHIKQSYIYLCIYRIILLISTATKLKYMYVGGRDSLG